MHASFTARLSAITLVISAGLVAHAQPYSIDWSKVSGGGGASSNVQYAISGTIGQHDAGAMSAGRYTVQGGFWGLIAAIQTPGAPMLRILNTGTNTLAVAWHSSSTSFTLEQNTDLNTTNWLPVDVVPNDDGTNTSVILQPLSGNRFFRLKWP